MTNSCHSVGAQVNCIFSPDMYARAQSVCDVQGHDMPILMLAAVNLYIDMVERQARGERLFIQLPGENEHRTLSIVPPKVPA